MRHDRTKVITRTKRYQIVQYQLADGTLWHRKRYHRSGRIAWTRQVTAG
jgi:hypothetical protein